jgi:hypothetical protein
MRSNKMTIEDHVESIAIFQFYLFQNCCWSGFRGNNSKAMIPADINNNDKDLIYLLKTIEYLKIPYKLVKSDHGYFDAKNGTIYYTNDTLKHELIHLLDYHTVNFNTNNPRHVLCSEIRANSLSGDCSVLKEFLRGNFRYDFKTCVMRRSKSSTDRLGLKTDDIADTVYEQCILDKFPFRE